MTKLLELVVCASLLCSGVPWAQEPASLPETPAPSSLPASPSQVSPAQVPTAQVSATPVLGTPVGTQTGGESITLDEAIRRARVNEPVFNAAVAVARTAQLDRSIARAQLLPQLVYHNQFIYTEGARLAHPASAATLNKAAADCAALLKLDPTNSCNTMASQTFVANNGVHEYVSQASVTETAGLNQFIALSRSAALASIADAELEISRRGLTVAVVTLFYNVLATEQKVEVERRALAEADKFVTQTGERELAREAAHADVIKAQLTEQQRQRDLADAQLAASKAKLDLAVLLFPDPRSPYTVVVPAGKPLESRAAFEAAANANNPELRSALSTLQARTFEIFGAQSAYLPGLTVNFLYGIDAPQFAVNGRRSSDSTFDNATRNLGYAAQATLDIPVFDWFATPNRIRQAKIVRDATRTVLSSAQRTLVAQLEEFYAESTLAEQQLESLDLSVRTARESLTLTQLRYTAGEATVLEVVDAQNSLTQAELARTDGQVRYQLSLANLQLLTGTL